MTALPSAPKPVASAAQSVPSLITPAMLIAAHADPAGAAKYGPALAACATRRRIVSRNAVHCLATMCLNESGGLKACQEDMYYTGAAWVAQVFHSHFPGGATQAVPYLRNPEKLGNYVYAALGGYNARGLGLGQVTGHGNHGDYARAIGKSEAEAVAYMLTPDGAADSACWYFVARGCAAPAEQGDLLAVRRIWAGVRAPTVPFGWLDGSSPGPVQKWGAQLRAAMGASEQALSGAAKAWSAAPRQAEPVSGDGADVSFPAG